MRALLPDLAAFRAQLQIERSVRFAEDACVRCKGQAISAADRNSSSTLVDFAGQMVRDRLLYGG